MLILNFKFPPIHYTNSGSTNSLNSPWRSFFSKTVNWSSDRRFFLMIRMWYLLMMMVLVEMFDQKRFRSCSFTNIHQYHVPVITWFIFYFIKSIRPLLTKARSIYQNWPKLTKMGSNKNWIEWMGIKWTFWTNECYKLDGQKDLLV